MHHTAAGSARSTESRMGCPPTCTQHVRSSPEDNVGGLQRTPVLLPNLISRPDIDSADLGLRSAVSQALQGLQHAMEDTQSPQPETPKQALQESPLHAMEDTQSPQLETPKQALQGLPHAMENTQSPQLETPKQALQESPLHAMEDTQSPQPETPKQALQGLPHAMENTQSPQLEAPKQALQESPLHAMEDTQSPQLETPKQALQGLPHAMENTQSPQLETPKQALQESPLHAMEDTQSPQLETPKQAPTPGSSPAAHGDVASQPFAVSPVLIGKQCWQDMLLHEVRLSEHDVYDDGLLILPHCRHVSNLQIAASQLRNADENFPAFIKHIAHTVASQHQRSEISCQGGAGVALA